MALRAICSGECLVGVTGSAHAELVTTDSGEHRDEVEAAVQTVFSQVPIPEHCRGSYARGIESFNEAHVTEVLRRGDDALASHMAAALAKGNRRSESRLRLSFLHGRLRCPRFAAAKCHHGALS